MTATGCRGPFKQGQFVLQFAGYLQERRYKLGTAFLSSKFVNPETPLLVPAPHENYSTVFLAV